MLVGIYQSLRDLAVYQIVGITIRLYAEFLLTELAWPDLSFESWDFALGTLMKYGYGCLV